MSTADPERLQIVGLGLATLDVLLRCEHSERASRGLGLRDFLLEGGGPVATALAAASKLGARTGLVGVAGSDLAGECKLDSLRRYGVDLSRVVRRPGPERQVILVWVDVATGERTFTGLPGVMDDAVRPEELDKDYIIGADILHLDGCHGEAALVAARWMRESGRKVVFDGAQTRGTVGERTRRLVGCVDVLICGSGFAQALTGEAETAAACRAVRALGPEIVVQTEGARGSFTASPSGEFHTPAFEVDVVDTTGAGDVFHGAYLVGLLRGWDPERIAVFASAVAAMKCTKVGGRAGVGSFGETVEFLRARGVDLLGRGSSATKPDR